jgi:hypothetical protein
LPLGHISNTSSPTLPRWHLPQVRADPAVHLLALRRLRLVVRWSMSSCGCSHSIGGSGVGSDTVRGLCVLPPRHPWQETMHAEFQLCGWCGLCWKPCCFVFVSWRCTDRLGLFFCKVLYTCRQFRKRISEIICTNVYICSEPECLDDSEVIIRIAHSDRKLWLRLLTGIWWCKISYGVLVMYIALYCIFPVYEGCFLHIVPHVHVLAFGQ